jgi:hypothetical protein
MILVVDDLINEPNVVKHKTVSSERGRYSSGEITGDIE